MRSVFVLSTGAGAPNLVPEGTKRGPGPHRSACVSWPHCPGPVTAPRCAVEHRVSLNSPQFACKRAPIGSPLQFSVSPTFFFKEGRSLTAMRTKQPNDQQDSLTAVFEALSLHPLPARLAAAPPNSIKSACRQRAAGFSRPLSCSERCTPGTEIRARAAMQPLPRHSRGWAIDTALRSFVCGT